MIFHPSKELLYAISDHMQKAFSGADLTDKPVYYVSTKIYKKDITEKVVAEIEQWMYLITTHFSTSVSAYKLDYDLYEGMFPTLIDDNLIMFQCDAIRDKPRLEDFFLFNEKS
jgi:hypothetical protein